MNRIIRQVCVSVLHSLLVASLIQAEPVLWSDRPARYWMTEGFPLGSGHLGAVPLGGTDFERILFNEKSLWTGCEEETGSHQAFGELLIKFDKAPLPTKYWRGLDLSNGMHTVTYERGGIEYRQEMLASYPSGVIALRISASKPGALSGRLWLTDMHGADVLSEGNCLKAVGILNNGLDYESQVLLVPKGGKVTPEFENGFDNKPLPRHRPGTPVLDGKSDVYLSLGNSDKPIVAHRASNNDATRSGLPLMADNQWFSRGVAFKAPGNYTFSTDGKYRWISFHAWSNGAHAVQVWADGAMVHQTETMKTGLQPQYVCVPLKGANSVKITAVAQPDAKGDDINLGHLRLSPSEKAPQQDPGVLRLFSKEDFGRIKHAPPVFLRFEGCDELTVYLTAGTSYVQDSTQGWRGKHPGEKITATLKKASAAGWEALVDLHLKDYQPLFNRVQFDVGRSKDAIRTRPTIERLQAFADRQGDPELESLLFQYGRYLLIASSRAGSLPANLQGVWNDSNIPPWRGDYHADINVQMNYWPADIANLSETFGPLVDWVERSIPVWRRHTQKEFNLPGWTVRGENGIFGGGTWHYVPAANSWLCRNLWDHYEFNLNREYLARIYPILKQVCEFWVPRLMEGPEGKLVTVKDFSPEHGPTEVGVSFPMRWVWDVFGNYAEAAGTLGLDAEFRSKILDMRGRMLEPQIGEWGQFKEWLKTPDDPNNKHRHVSHLVGLYPGEQISVRKTPELAKACAVSLNARGDMSTGWAMAWRVALWARLHDGDRAYKLVRNQLKFTDSTGIDYNKGGTYANLLCAHPPFQIDGNFGFVAGICEMLLQSHEGEIAILPALPSAWQTGKIHGIRARGGFELDLDWKEGALTSVGIRHGTGGEAIFRYQDKVRVIQVPSKKTVIVNGNLQ